MNLEIPCDPTKQHCALWVFDCSMGNPNGDPDFNNLPRQDLSTGIGFITDVALKRRIRNYFQVVGQTETPENYKILIQEKSVINETIERCYTELGFDVKSLKNRTTVEEQQQVLKYIISNFVDVRLFGGVLSTGSLKAGQYTGPVSITFAKSVDPIVPCEIAITRCASTTRDETKENKTIGKKTYIPYGLYVTKIFYSPCNDVYQQVSEKDLRLFWDAVANCFELNRTASKGHMATQNLWIFSHRSKYGDMPAHKLFNTVKLVKKCDGSPLTYDDYEVQTNFDNLPPEKITVTCWR